MHPPHCQFLARAPLYSPVFISPISPARQLFPFALARLTRRLVVSQDSTLIETVNAATGDEMERIDELERNNELERIDELEKIGEMERFIEVGNVRSTHGVKGEVKVEPTTDFPEIRFGKAGKRWLRIQDRGKDIIKEIFLSKGRNNPGQNGWIISFKGIDSIDKAMHIIGSTILVPAEDKPELDQDEGEFYTPDLVGMRVILKETGKLVGTLSSILSTKGNDILQVKPTDSSSEDSYIMIPFVDEIVPDVDLSLGEMRITPPEGLLELNSKSNTTAKKEKRLMEWKQKKKSQQRLSTNKKILTEMEQMHVLDALRLADKTQKPKLGKQIASIDFRLFQHVMKNLNKPKKGFSEDMDRNFSFLLKNAMKISHESLIGNNRGDNGSFNGELRAKGLDILNKSKAAFVIIKRQKSKIGNEFETNDEIMSFLEDIGEVLQGEDGTLSGPLVIITPTHEVEIFEECLRENNYFGLDHQKVWVLEEGRLPIYNLSSDQKKSKILLKSSFELLEAPIGPGGVFSLLSLHKFFDAFNQMGIEYLQVCSFDDKSSLGNPIFFGYVNSLGSNIGLKLHENNKGDETSFDIIISMKHVNKISRHLNKLRFDAILEKHVHVEKGSDGWVDVEPDAFNAYRINFPLYGLLDSCSINEMCVMNVVHD